MEKKHLLVRAARGEPVERPPIWAMRQAGRWDPEFNRVRAGQSFYAFSEDVESAARASLCPRRFGVDAIILFYDITTLPMAMGLPFELQPGAGPVPDRPIRTAADLERLNANPEPASYAHIRNLLRCVKDELRGELPVIVFAGAPFTVATYCIGTGKDIGATRRFAAEHPDVWIELLHKLNVATVYFLNTLIDDGADVYQLFDSWAGMLSLAEYDAWAQPFHTGILAGAIGVPRILFVKEGPYLDRMPAAARMWSASARGTTSPPPRLSAPRVPGQRERDVLREGTPSKSRRRSALRLPAAANGMIVNPQSRVDKATPVANFEACVRRV